MIRQASAAIMAVERSRFGACSDFGAYSFEDPSENKGLTISTAFPGKYKVFTGTPGSVIYEVWPSYALAIILTFSEYDNFLLTQVASHFGVNQKRVWAKYYQFVHSKSTVQINISRSHELAMECYIDSIQPGTLGAYLWPTAFLPKFEGLLRLPVPERTAIHPEQEFVPSKELVRRVKDGMALPADEELVSLLRDLRLLDVPDEERERNVAALITEQVEGMLASLAKRYARTGKKIRITTGSRFTPEICEDLTFRLGLDQYNPASILNLLHAELMDFLSSTRKRDWGSISAIKGETQFLVNKDAFARPDYSKILNDDKWEVA